MIIVKIVKTENNVIVTTIHLQNLKTLLGIKNCNALATDILQISEYINGLFCCEFKSRHWTKLKNLGFTQFE